MQSSQEIISEIKAEISGAIQATASGTGCAWLDDH